VKRLGLICLILLFIASGSVLLSRERVSAAQELPNQLWILGTIQDSHGQPVKDVNIHLFIESTPDAIGETKTQTDGRFALQVPEPLPDQLSLRLDRPHFQQIKISLKEKDLSTLNSGNSFALPTITLEREINSSFWVAGIVFVLVLALIATGFLHNTLAAFAGASFLLAISYLGTPITNTLHIFEFPQAISYIDWNVIYLIMGMMMVIAVIENTGIFHWLAYFAYRISGGRMWILLSVLMLITGIASAFLDNVTTMLLMTPITVQIALALNVSPLVLLIPEVFASNVIGVSTLIGTPTNILIGSFGNITFNNFLTNLSPGVFLAFIGLIIYSWLTYRKELSEAKIRSPALLEKLEERGKITNPENLKKAGWIGGGMMLLFVFGETIHLLPSVTALIGASALLIWIRPDIDDMIGAVD